MQGFTDKQIEKLKKVKMLITDVDGVLTDGGLYYTADGLVMKKFYVKDGFGSFLLREHGFKVGIITSDKSPMGQVRGARLQFDYVYTGIFDKHEALHEICEKEGFSPEAVAYIGDDLNDRSIIAEAGFTVAPKDAHSDILAVVDYISELKGGEGVFREIADAILTINSIQY